MIIAVIDGMGGGIGAQVVNALRDAKYNDGGSY